MLPAFYEHCAKLSDGLDLLFAHRWILLCFKREFPERGWSHSKILFILENLEMNINLFILFIVG